MIIDQLPALQTAGDNDEIVIEVGTTTYKIKKENFLKEFMPKSGGEFTGDVTANGVLDVTNRRVKKDLDTVGWKRVLTVGNGYGGFGYSGVIDLTITRAYNNTNNESHKVSLFINYDASCQFLGEQSFSNTQIIDKIRYTTDGSRNGHLDIHYNSTALNSVTVDYVVHNDPERQQYTTAEGLTSVNDAPSGETVLTTYDFAGNTNGDVSSSFTTSKGTVNAYRSGNIVTLSFVGNSTTWASDEVFATIDSSCRPIMNIDVVSYIGRQAVIVRLKQNGDVVLYVASTLTGNQRLYFSCTYQVA